jgi:hypothetical protein
MSIQLPPPIALYVQLENAGDPATLSACFAPNAIVRDEGRTYEGLAAITAWKAETKKKYHHTVTPLDVAQQHSKTVLTATLTGDFPGSPATVTFEFVLEAGKILSLEIHA